jgi:GNAT superfamily N-acetyltransferase
VTDPAIPGPAAGGAPVSGPAALGPAVSVRPAVSGPAAGGPAAGGPGVSGPAVVIRPAGVADGAALAGLRAEGVEDPTYPARFAAWWAAESGRRRAWLAYSGDEPVGMVNLTVFERMPRPGQPPSRWGYLGNAYVRPEWRSRGIGTALLDALLAYARAEGYARILLAPSEPSVPFYRRAGFGPADTLLLRSL